MSSNLLKNTISCTFSVSLLLLFVSIVFLKDNNLINNVPKSAYSTIQELSKSEVSINIEKNKTSLRWKITGLIGIAITIIVFTAIISVTQSSSATLSQKAFIFIPNALYISATVILIYMLEDTFERIANNRVGPGYYTYVLASSIIHGIYGLIVLFAKLAVTQLMPFTCLAAVLLLTFNLKLYEWLYQKVTDG